jgi:DNA repair exonuclease SbcCD ATPase subunit
MSVNRAVPRCAAAVAIAMTLAISALPAPPAFGQVARSGGSSGGGAATAALQQQLQQLASERTSLQSENTQLKKQLDDIKKERDTLKSAQQSQQQGLALRLKSAESAAVRSAAAKESTETQLTDLKARSQELVAKFRETAQSLRDVEVDRTKVTQKLAQRDAELKSCAVHNDALFKLNEEMLAKLDGQGAFSRLASLEPFTKLKRIELENLADDMRTRAVDQHVEAQPASK